MFNYTVLTIVTSSTSSVSVYNDGFMEYNKLNKMKNHLTSSGIVK